jgi:mannose-6-phosphate isomerase-like protein (cupin superfamily)
MLIRPGDVAEEVESANAVVMRALVPAVASGGDLSVTWVQLRGHHRRLRTRRSARVYYVLTGSARFVVGEDERFEARGGDVVVISRDTPYEFEGEMTYLVINGPGYVAGDDEYL